MDRVKLQQRTYKKKGNTQRRKEGEAGVAFFQMFYIFFLDDSRKKYRFIFLFFHNGWRSLQDEGVRNENSKG